MERYEINKYLQTFQKKTADLFESLEVEKNRPIIDELEAETHKEGFWLDQKNAQEIISKLNLLREKVNDYEIIKKSLDDLLELNELSLFEESFADMLESEIYAFEKDMTLLEEKALLSGKYDYMDCIMDIHPGAGGTESMDWADMLYRMYSRYFLKVGFKMSLIDYQPGDEAGIKSITFAVKGKNAYGLLKGERGVHRLVRISPFDSQSRRHTSFASVEVAPQIEESSNIEIKDEDIKIDVYHSSGAGGQSVNTTDSAVRITHKLSGIVVTCQNERSQIKNREIAMKILKSKLLELEIRRQEDEMRKLKGTQLGIDFGSQIRSYVFCPYTLVKDHRTDFETGNVNAVMDGDISGFIDAYLKYNAGE